MGKVIMFDEVRAARHQQVRPAQEHLSRSGRTHTPGPFAPAHAGRLVEGATTLAWWPVTFGLKLWEHSLEALGTAAAAPEQRPTGARVRRQ